MATCKDCIHERVCLALIEKGLPYADGEYPAEAFCMTFRNKADFEKVVRCKNCKHSRPMIFSGFHYCKRVRAVRKEDGFCSKGIPKERGDE